MDESQVVNEVKSCEDLFGDALKSTDGKVWLTLLNFSIVLRVFIKVVSKQFSNDEQVFLVVEEVKKLE